MGVAQFARLLAYEYLTNTGMDGRAMPGLARSWHSSDDGLLWRFKLRPDIRFHDGTDLTAQTVVDALFDSVQDGGLKSAPGRLSLMADVAELRATDAETIEIHLHRPSGLLLGSLAETVIGRGNNGTGPFHESSRRQDLTILQTFEPYWGGIPSIDRLELRSYPTVRTAWAAMMRGEIDFLYEVGGDALEFVQRESSVQVFSFLRPYTLSVVFNLHHPVLGEPQVRRALNHAVDRRALVERALRGRGLPAYGHIWPEHWAYDPDLSFYSHDPSGAGAKLKRAGYGSARLASSGMSEQPPNRFSFECLVPEGMPHLERIALVMQRQLLDIGVHVAIVPLSVSKLFERLRAGNFDAALLDVISARSLTWPYRLWHSKGGRQLWLESGYTAADEALDRILYARNEDEIRLAVREVQRVLHEDPPALFLAWDVRARAVSRRFEVPAEPGRDIIHTLWQWRPVEAAALQ